MGENRERRRSFFDGVQEQTDDSNTVLKEWDQRWGKYNLDYVNVLTYPADYVQKIKDEKEMRLKELEKIRERVKALLAEEKEFKHADLHVTENILSTEQKASLRAIDSRINKFMKKSTTFAKNFEVYKRMLEVKLEQIERESKLVDRLAAAKK